MLKIVKNILRLSAVALVVPGLAFGVQQQNPRGGNGARNVARSADAVSSAAIRRSATSVIARSTNSNGRKSRTVVVARPGISRSASVRSSVMPAFVARTASNKSSVARSGTKQKVGGSFVSRAGVARATAVFNDVSKIGSGYSDCREAYATCMDQMCANANDTYRRCFCSDRFTSFRETEDKMNTAIQMLAEFQDNNLEAVNKTAAEVDAMYSSTAGEDAIKRDTSASQELLNNIGDILAGKKTAATPKKSTSSLGVLDFSGFGSSNDDIFGGSSSLFDSRSSYTDMSSLEGKELYDSALKQCSEITREACNSDAMFNLARSAYSIMITQDCNAYEKNINAKKASIEETVRTAGKYLREARLDDFHAHNSPDVNECLTKVESAMRQPLVCGEKYEKCLDYTGRYINTSTGEPIYSQALLGLNTLINLDGSADVLSANADFAKWLEGKKRFVETALDTCRSNADFVWEEFKRMALIQIAQAQDEKIQEVKDSCVATIKQCYDKQTGDLKSIDTTETAGTDAIAAVTARGMCYDRVKACAALYGDPNGCDYDGKTKTLKNNGSSKCGLQSLLAFVDTVDSVKAAEGCESVLTKYAAELCPDEEVKDSKTGEITKTIKYGTCKKTSKAKIRAAMNNRMETFCAQDLINADNSNDLLSAEDKRLFNVNIMNQVVKSIYDELGIAFTMGCDEFDGQWVDVDSRNTVPDPSLLEQRYYEKYYDARITNSSQYKTLGINDYGWCLAIAGADLCNQLGSEYATYENDNCNLKDKWYNEMCTNVLKGSWNNNQCVISNFTGDF